MGAGIAIGVAIGAGLGVALGNMAFMGVGVAIGVAIGAAMSRSKRARDEGDRTGRGNDSDAPS